MLANTSKYVVNISSEDYVREWLDYLDKANYSGATGNTYAQAWRNFHSFVDGEYSTVGQDTVLAWMNFLKKDGKAPATIRVWKSGVASFYRWFADNIGHIENPANVKLPRKKRSKKTKRKVLSNNEVQAILDGCEDSQEGRRDRLVLSLLAYCALRGVEVLRANVDNIDTINGRTVLYVQGKGAEEADEYVVLPIPAEVALRSWLKVREDVVPLVHGLGPRRNHDRRLSPSWLRAMVKRRFAEAGVVNGGKTTHSLRHTAITNAILQGATPLQVMAMARHTSFDTTMQYFHDLSRLEHPAEDLIAYS